MKPNPSTAVAATIATASASHVQVKAPGLVRVLGLKESIGMTIGTVVGVGIFTCGSAQVGLVGPWIIVFTFLYFNIGHHC